MRKPMTLNGIGIRNIGFRGLTTLLLLGALSGCGGNNTSDEANIIIETGNVEFGVIERQSGSAGSGIGVTGPVIFRVVKSDTDLTPVPGARVALVVGSSSSQSASISDPISHVQLNDAFGLYVTTADSRGVVKVDATAVTNACPTIPIGGSDVTFSGSLSVAAFVAADSQTWSLSFSVKCSAP